MQCASAAAYVRPPRNLQVKMTNDVRRGTGDPVEPALVTKVITKRGTRDGSNQPGRVSDAEPGACASSNTATVRSVRLVVSE